MRLTSSSIGGSSQPPASPGSSRLWAFPVLVVGYLAIFALDCTTGTAPVQHLYYLPIILAAYHFGKRGGLTAALAGAVLYHFANRSLLAHQYQESDIVQIALFLVVGVVTAKLVNDAQKLRVLSMTDDLTGLHNLRSFEARLLGLVRASRQANVPFSRVEIQLHYANVLRLSENATAKIANLAPNQIQVQVGQGLVNYSVAADVRVAATSPAGGGSPSIREISIMALEVLSEPVIHWFKHET
jgi:K+-sensing histidine kinase KdpD